MRPRYTFAWSDAVELQAKRAKTIAARNLHAARPPEPNEMSTHLGGGREKFRAWQIVTGSAGAPPITGSPCGQLSRSSPHKLCLLLWPLAGASKAAARCAAAAAAMPMFCGTARAHALTRRANPRGERCDEFKRTVQLSLRPARHSQIEPRTALS